MRTREGMQVARAKGRLKGKQPKLKPNQARHLVELHDLGTYSPAELAALFGVGRSTIYRTLERTRLAVSDGAAFRRGSRRGTDWRVEPNTLSYS